MNDTARTSDQSIWQRQASDGSYLAKVVLAPGGAYDTARELILTNYENEYDVRDLSVPSRLVTLLTNGEVVAAAGITLGPELEFFSLCRDGGARKRRDQLVEEGRITAEITRFSVHFGQRQRLVPDLIAACFFDLHQLGVETAFCVANRAIKTRFDRLGAECEPFGKPSFDQFEADDTDRGKLTENYAEATAPECLAVNVASVLRGYASERNRRFDFPDH